jgi:PAS domain S-box-containing protein
MPGLAGWFQSDLQIVDLAHALAFIVMGVAILVQPKRREAEALPAALPWFVAYVLVRSLSDFIDIRILAGSGDATLSRLSLSITFLAYAMVFEFGRRLHNASFRPIPAWATAAAMSLVVAASAASADPSTTADALIGYLFRLPAGILMAAGYWRYFSTRRERLEPLGCRNLFAAAAATSLVWGICGVFRAKASFFPATWLNGESFAAAAGFPVQLARTFCALAMVYPLLGILRVFNREMVSELERHREGLERRLSDAEHRFTELVEQSLVGIYILDGEAFAYANPKLAEMWGAGSGDELVGRSVMEYVLPEDRENVRDNIRRRLIGEIRSIKYALRIRRADGEIRTIEVHGSRAGFAGKPAIIGTMLDITDRLRSEEALRESEARYAVAVRGSNDGIWDWNFRTGHLYFSDRCKEMTGFAGEDVDYCIDEWTKRIHPEDFDRVLAAIQGSLAGGVPHFEVEYRLRHKDGGWRWVQARAICLFDACGNPDRMAGSLTDLTDRKRLEEQLQQAQKMEAVGRLAGGVAHDFNNLLTAILGYCELLLDKLDPHDPIRHDVEEINKAGERAASVTGQLLAFSRRQIMQPKVLNFNDVVRSMDKMLQRLIGEDVELETRTQAGIPNVKIDPGQLGQVLVNLAVNARDAMPDGGRLIIETSVATADDLSPAAESGCDITLPAVLLSVSDTGIGMDEATRGRIFEPFFTTKAKGKGTGLGLSTTYGIVRQSGGQILVESSPGNGTAFRLFFPAVPESAGPVEVTPVFEKPPACEGTILVVEDEEAVRRLVRETLERAGYRVLVAADGEEGLDVAGRFPGEIPLVLTDVVMPRMGGFELVDRLESMRPGIRVVLMSGYSAESLTHQGAMGKGRLYIQKPFRPDALIRKIHEATGVRSPG